MKSNFTCCNDLYLQNPIHLQSNFDENKYTCCNYEFKEKKENYQCCGNNYIEVLKNQICCIDPKAKLVQEIKINLGYGDSCCGNSPYYRNSTTQLCCQNELRSSFGMQCCGEEYTQQDRICCANYSYIIQNNFKCCGNSYYDETNTNNLCCGRSTNAILYNLTSKISSDYICCDNYLTIKPTNLLSTDNISCCKWNIFDLNTHVCANRFNSTTVIESYELHSTQICPKVNENSAICGICNFQYNFQKCYIKTVSIDQICWTEIAKIEKKQYNTFEFQYLKSYTNYRVKIKAFNSIGSIESDYTQIRTNISIPTDIFPPRINVININSMDIHWRSPLNTNGDILFYVLYRSNKEPFNLYEEVYRGTSSSMIDNRDIKPFQRYFYIIQACNIAGCVNSSEISVFTKESIPNKITDIKIENTSTNGFYITWNPPVSPNGFITKYNVYLNDINKFGLISTAFLANNLSSFNKYYITVEICNSIGCKNSSKLSIITEESDPENIPDLLIIAVNESSMNIRWFPPLNPNGIITKYKLFGIKNTIIGSNLIVHIDTLPNMTRNFVLTNRQFLSVFVEYFNNAGSKNSSISDLKYPSKCASKMISNLSSIALSHSSLSVTWNSYNEPINQYIILIHDFSGFRAFIGAGLSTKLVIDNLKPFTNYEQYLLICLTNIEGFCCVINQIISQTTEDKPRNLLNPILSLNKPNVIKITWSPPRISNGKIISYTISRKQSGTDIWLDVSIVNNVENVDFFEYNDDDSLIAFNTLYEYKLKVINRAGYVESNVSTIKTGESLPQKLQNIVVNYIEFYSVNLQWFSPGIPNGIIKSYIVFWDEENTFGENLKNIEVNVSITSTILQGLESNKLYKVRYGVVNSAGISYSPWTLFETKKSSPDYLGKVKTTNLNINQKISISVEWDKPIKPNGDFVIYTLFIRIKGEISKQVVYNGTSHNTILYNLKPYTNYELVLLICNLCCCTEKYGIIFNTPQMKPENFSSIVFNNIKNISLDIIFSLPKEPNGVIIRFEIFRRSSFNSQSNYELLKVLPINFNNVSKDLNFSFSDNNLIPFTQYQYQINACNNVGCNSMESMVITNEGIPENILPPNLKYTLFSLFIQIDWIQPQITNGIITKYIILRNESDKLFEFNNNTFSMIDNSVAEDKLYIYKILACTSAGCSASNKSYILTYKLPPQTLVSPYALSIYAESVKLTWYPCNCSIEKYILRFENDIIYEGKYINSSLKTGLKPYTNYSADITFCTLGGCKTSFIFIFRTDESLPEGLSKPLLSQTNKESIIVSLKPVSNSNGLIKFYSIIKNDSLIASLTHQFKYIDNSNIVPGSYYFYKISATNSKGVVVSNSTFIYSLEDIPRNIDKPIIKFFNSKSVIILWKEPTQPNGVIVDQFIFEQYLTTINKYSLRLQSSQISFNNLNPFTNYNYFLMFCTKIGCSNSSSVSFRTLEDIPSGQSPPNLEFIVNLQDPSMRKIKAKWQSPTYPNGIIKTYRLERTNLITNFDNIIIVYEGINFDYDDLFNIQYFTNYFYRITSFNSLPNGISSSWSQILTAEGIPQNISKPIIININSRYVILEINSNKAQYTNGKIIKTIIRINNTQMEVNHLKNITFSNLIPFTFYEISLILCTSAGCNNGNSEFFRTIKESPDILNDTEIKILVVDSQSLKISWLNTASINGVLISYILEMKYKGESKIIYDGLETAIEVNNLNPYSKYEFSWRIKNDIGISKRSNWKEVWTKTSFPQFISDPILTKNYSNAILNFYMDWTKSFVKNGPFERYDLKIGDTVKSNLKNSTYIIPNPSFERLQTFQIFLTTNVSTISSPKYQFDSNNPNNFKNFTISTVTSDPIQFFQETWFIILIISIVVVIIFVVIGLTYFYRKRNIQYYRERNPINISNDKVSGLSIFSEVISEEDASILSKKNKSGIYNQFKNDLAKEKDIANSRINNGHNLYLKDSQI